MKISIEEYLEKLKKGKEKDTSLGKSTEERTGHDVSGT